jgi:cobalt-zinc-cadmium efflux system outer membrane protein
MRPPIVLLAGLALAASLSAQTPVTRQNALDAALGRGARLAVASADTAVANATVIAARVRPNPSVTGSYSKSVPNYHFTVDLPIEFPALRALRVRAAEVGLRAAELKFQFDRAMIAMEADTAYTRAVAARERVVLSQRTALDADSLLHMVERRRDAGDASDMDVELARVNAGQQANIAAADTLTMVSTYLDLQGVLGLVDDRVAIVPTDSLTAVPEAVAPAATSLSEASAAASLEAATLNTQLQHRSVWSQFSIAVGFEQGDPDAHGILPTFGVGVGLPLFDRNRGPIAQAEAERARAQATLALARVEMRNALGHALRERENAIRKVARDRLLISSANRVAAMSLTAYREGASTLANVLEAQRTAREVLSQYIDDLAAAWIATAELRVFSLTSTPAAP